MQEMIKIQFFLGGVEIKFVPQILSCIASCAC